MATAKKAKTKKLTKDQWEEIKARMLANEPIRVLAREFGCSDTAIRKRFGSQLKTAKTLANQLVAAEQEIKKQPLGLQIDIANIADRLRRVMDSLTEGAEHGAAIYAKASRLARSALDRVDPENPMNDVGHIQAANALTRVGNDAAQVPMALLKEARDAAKSQPATSAAGGGLDAVAQVTPEQLSIAVRNVRDKF